MAHLIEKIDKGNKQLRIYQNKNGLRGSVVENKRVVMSAQFYEKDRDDTIHRVKEYFNFL